jgi:hypothetical protein
MPKPRKQVSAAQTAKIVDWYTNGYKGRQYGINDIGDALGHAGTVIKRVLVEQGVTIRPVGRPRKVE